ncbi:CoF synthetase [Aquimarina sp. 2201CG5-10]|uniref:CoF synthetase n=1 Tax=Aquimarina callyspongiae TaxID=3098150 RepID=UPI002AB527DB|nr:CoF synthetase [Aquimarina sp. 2201CG5-10]MDY8136286.1 CoF synthetase [Aquimarina sp. 2201CG5-10]
MKISEFLRNKVFWSIDKITGKRKKKHYNEIKYIAENQDDPEIKSIIKNNLQNILQHAQSSTPFYASVKANSSIEDFPVIHKNLIRENFEDFRSEKFLDKPKFEVTTSGSTGTPFMVYQDQLKKLRNTADNIYFSELAGFKIGYKLLYFRFWKAFEEKGVIMKWLQNIQPIDVFSLNKDDKKKEVFNQVQKNSSSISWLGYASAFEEMCKFMERNNHAPIRNKVKSAIAISESLNDYTIAGLRKYFGVTVVSRYSNVENGIIAQQLIDNETSYFIINQASYYVEILDMNSDTPVNDGTPGRIVITDLFNYCMPIIRYDTGDIGTKDIIDGKAVLTRVEGRKVDLITNTKGEIIYNNLMLIVIKYPLLKQCQLVQKEIKKYLLKINVENGFSRENELVNEFKEYLGEDAQITVEYVDEIPLLASGKRRVIVNEMVSV